MKNEHKTFDPNTKLVICKETFAQLNKTSNYIIPVQHTPGKHRAGIQYYKVFFRFRVTRRVWQLGFRLFARL
jgi:hypothetical protein